jgi:hypothetical protein
MRCGGKSPLGNTGRRYSSSARGDHVFVEPPVYGEVGGGLRMAGLLDAEQWVADGLERWRTRQARKHNVTVRTEVEAKGFVLCRVA